MPREALKDRDRIQLTGVSTTRQHRTLDERIFVRFPALARKVFYLWSRLPKGSGLRRWLLVRNVVHGMSAGNRRDFDVLLLGFDPEIDYRAVSAGPFGGVAPDLVGHHHGHAGYRYVWRAMLDGFEDLTLEPEELVDLGDLYQRDPHERARLGQRHSLQAGPLPGLHLASRFGGQAGRLRGASGGPRGCGAAGVGRS